MPSQDKHTVIDEKTKELVSQKKQIRDLMEGPQFRDAVRAVLPETMRPDRFVRVCLTALVRTPDLAKCTQESLFRALLDLSMYGLEPDGRRAHLIPFGQECQLILDYKGIAELVRRSGDVSYIHADVVYPHDEVWSYEYGTDQHLRHKPALTNRGDRIIAAYSFVKLKDGMPDFIVMNAEEVERIRLRSKAKDKGPWVTDYDEMAKKTAFRRHSKWLPLSAETREAIERDDEVTGVNQWHELVGESAEKKPELKEKLRRMAEERREQRQVERAQDEAQTAQVEVQALAEEKNQKEEEF